MHKRKRFPVIRYTLAFLLIILIAGAPIISVVIAGSIANAHGCRLDENGIYPCLINGVDYGRELATMAMMGWLMLATLPFGAMAGFVLLVICVLHFISWRRRATSN
jgi:hypothetical protein